MTDTIPVIDCAPLASLQDCDIAPVAAAIGRACRSVGFFYAINAPIPAALRDEAFAAARTFFASPLRDKQSVSIVRSAHNRGYVGLLAEALDPSAGPDHKEAFNIGLDLPADDPEVQAGLPFRGVNLWPDPAGFKTTMLAYYKAVWGFGVALHRAVALDLGLPAATFEPMLDRPMATLRLLHYPARTIGGPSTVGAGTHTDYGNLTLLATDETGGLEVQRRDGRWLAAPARPDAFVCNIGDCLMRWTNDVYVSTPHRVVAPPDRDRYSIAFFLDPNPDATVACLPSCLDPQVGARYRPIKASDHLAERLDRTYAHRRGPA